MAIKFAELVGGDLADEAGPPSERRDSSSGIAGRTAADLMGRTHVRIESLGFFCVDQAHRAFHQSLLGEEVVGGVGNHVDDGVTDAQDIEALVRHSGLRTDGKRAA